MEHTDQNRLNRAQRTYSHHLVTKGLLLLLLWTLLLGCQPTTPSTAATGEGSGEAESAETAVTDAASTAVSTAAISTTETADTAVAAPATEGDASLADEAPAAAPIRMTIPAIDFAAAIEPMAWRVTEVEGTRQAVWEVPAAAVGWHINSAPPGMPGNMILSGHHLTDGAVFAPLARGEVAVGDEIQLFDDNGQGYSYQVTEISEPIPVSGASAAEQERVAAYQAMASEPTLTLITGWPDFSDTHYLFIVAAYSGEME